MFYDEIFGKIDTVEVLDMARRMVGCSSAFVDEEVNQMHYGYFLWQTRRKISEIMDSCESPLLQVTYDALVNRNSYLLHIKNSVGGYNMEPHELNMKREEELQKAMERMQEIPVEGYERYAIVKYSLNLKMDTISVSELRKCVASSCSNGNISVFLWYDFNKRREDLMFPIITW